MSKTVQPERPEADRRKKNRLVHVKFKRRERTEFVRWYVALRGVLHHDLRKKKVKFFILGVRGKDLPLPQDAVRQELRHIFQEDWKCALAFNDIDKAIHMIDLR